MVQPRVGPGQSSLHLIPSIPHLLLYLLVSLTFPFLTRFIYFLSFPSLPILPVVPLRFQAGLRRRRLNLALVFLGVDFMLYVFFS